MTTDPSSAASRSTQQRQWACGECDRRWSGLRTCHCATCHRTFTAITPFDQHRRGGMCLDPTEIGLVLTDRPYPCWGNPADTRWATARKEN